MSFERRDNSGALFKNTRKTSEKHPDYTGKITVGGVEFWLSAWIKEGSQGKFMSLSVKPKEEKRPTQTSGLKNEDMDDEIPF